MNRTCCSALPALLVLLAWLTVRISAQELSTLIFPSEDEIAEAYESGEISFSQFVLLQEIIARGIDLNSLYLLDEIPNLAYFGTAGNSIRVPLEDDQSASFIALAPLPAMVHGKMTYRFFQPLDEDETTWYRTSCDLKVGSHIQAKLRVHREKSGYERYVERSVTWSSHDGALRRLIVGNFTTRFGLGTMFGYRGKIMDYSEGIDGESFLYPDYGGYNGLYAQTTFDELEVQSLASVTRDDRHQLQSYGAVARINRGHWRPGLLVGLNRLEDRDSGVRVSIPMYGVCSEYSYRSGYVVAELSRQAGRVTSALSGVVEGQHRFEPAEIRYAGWAYGDDFIDLTAGSKAGSLTRQVSMDEVNFTCSSKRPGQEGLLFRTAVELTSDIVFTNSILYAARNSDNANIQFSSALLKRLNRRCSIQIDYLGRVKKRFIHGATTEETDNRVRLEGRLNDNHLAVRSYIAYNDKSDNSSYLSLFVKARYRFDNERMIELWSNLNRINDERVDYWYFYLRGEQSLWQSMTAAVKLSHIYNRTADDRSRFLLSLEVSALI